MEYIFETEHLKIRKFETTDAGCLYENHLEEVKEWIPNESYADMEDMQDYEKTQATLKLMGELAKGKKSGEEKGWLSSSDVRAHFRAKANEE